jgi:beta-fructofuranosidase
MKRRQFIESLTASALAFSRQSLFASVGTPLKGAPAGAPQDEEAPREFFYRPADAWAADFIPFYKDGRFHLFFLLDWRDKVGHGEGTPWFQVSTTDFVHFREHGEMLPRGTRDDQDLFVFTGSVTQGEGKYHIFYTGHNPYFPAKGRPEQGIMHAVSDDLTTWQKVPDDTFYAPSDRYEPNDWRDPFVFWNKEAGEYWMLLAARLKNGPSRRRGCTTLCASKDLKKWEVREPFWAPGLYFTHECPDLFRIGDWWYLIFSEFTDLFRTRYRMSRSLKGPWLIPEDDCFDARAFYAAKTASDGQRRFLFGWDPTRSGKQDYKTWNWGGNLIVHELSQQTDATLSVSVPKTVDDAWGNAIVPQFSDTLGNVALNDRGVQISSRGSFSCSTAGRMPDRCRIEAVIEFEPGTIGCGIMLRTSDDLESSYYVCFEPGNRRLVFDSWPRDLAPRQSAISVDGGMMPGLDRRVDLKPHTPIRVKIFVDRTIAVIYVADKCALSTRMYDLPVGRWGFFVSEGNASFRDISMKVL